MNQQRKKGNNRKDRYKFSVSNNTTFEEIWSVRMKKYTVFLLVVAIFLFVVAATVSLLSFTKLRELIPGYPNAEVRRDMLINALRLDSLEHEIELRDQYFANLNSIISGKKPAEDFSMQKKTYSGTLVSPADSLTNPLLMSNNEEEEKVNIFGTDEDIQHTLSLANMHFFPPVTGIISSSFNAITGHFGTDIVAKPESLVAATLDGTVILTGWTLETGFVIVIQHDNNIISIYKHNAFLLKKTGDIVRAGEPLSIIGDSGELYTSGPHLHFEIWYKGYPLDPERHVFF